MSLNNFCFTGNLGKDCRMGNAGGYAVCNFSVAVKSGFGNNEQTLWVDVSLWGKAAEGKLPDYLLKGQQVAVSGELGTREHEGKTYLTCRANSVSLIGKRDESHASAAPVRNEPKPASAEDDDGIPF